MKKIVHSVRLAFVAAFFLSVTTSAALGQGKEIVGHQFHVVGSHHQMLRNDIITIDLPSVTPPVVYPPTVEVPGAEAPVVDLPEADPPLVDVSGISVPGIEVREEDDFALIRIPGDILFDFDKSDIRPDAAISLSQVLDVLNSRYPDARFTVHGHTDAKGTEAYNLTLSEARAVAVRNWFIDNGISVERMTTVGHGETRPVAPNTYSDGSDNPAGRQLNRRVEVAIRRR